MCGLPTSSKYGMCQRAGACGREYRRLWARDQDAGHRNEVVRRYRLNHKVPSQVYAILFPLPEVLKVGLTSTDIPAVTMGSARMGARKRGWEVSGSTCIWREPGDVRAEAWMQATLSFRWPAAARLRQTRISEWFDVSALTVQEVTAVLAEIYEGLPVDAVAG